MNYVKQFKINGVDTRQVACIELNGKPNAATEGYVGALGMDITSPLHDVYKCVAVNGGVFAWELLSSGLSIMSATISGEGATSMRFPYGSIKKPDTYVVKNGDLILDGEGYLYQITALNTTYCETAYSGTRVVAYGLSAYDLAVKNGYEGSETDWLKSLEAVAEVTEATVNCDSSAWVTDNTNGGYYQTIAVEGIRSVDTPIVDVLLGDDIDANALYLNAWGSVTRVTTADGSVTIYANSRLPTTAFTMRIKAIRSDE